MERFRKLRYFVTCIALLLAIVPRCEASEGLPLTACAAASDSPPYLYTETNERGTVNRGLGVDALQAVFHRLHLNPPLLRRLPWARCLQDVAQGNIDIAINVGTAQVDPAPYWISEIYIDVRSVYVFSKSFYPDGLKIKDLHELRKFRICGLLGSRYDAYGIDSDQIDIGPTDYFSLFRKINARRCEIAIENAAALDILLHQNSQLRQLYEQLHLSKSKMPQDDMLGLHFAISRKMKNGEALRNSINTEIRDMRSNHVLEKELEQYLVAKPKD
ncbi:MAG: ABC transporter substrate-binding protein [Paucibacter sp.]|nr:ABC transporter substrate-binding protein [Roseateles sp.]